MSYRKASITQITFSEIGPHFIEHLCKGNKTEQTQRNLIEWPDRRVPKRERLVQALCTGSLTTVTQASWNRAQAVTRCGGLRHDNSHDGRGVTGQ